jgi:hypothetical protein
LLKRFESSAYAFAQTCRRMAASHGAFLDLLGRGRVAVGDDLREWIATDRDDMDASARELPKGAHPAAAYDVARLRTDVESDRDLLLAFAAQAEKVGPEDDPKLAALAEELANIAAQADEEGVGIEDTRNKRKVIIFSYYADTIEWVAEYLDKAMRARGSSLKAFKDRMVAVSGNGGNRSDAMFGFAPQTTDAPPGKDEDRYDLLLATDVLAEGVNLQQARHIVNYDLPWNPMRLVQRHGRVDRIGSPHARVYIRCFFPDEKLDELLGLEERLQRKIRQAAASVGVSDEVIPGSKTEEHVFAENREQILKLQGLDPTIFATGGEQGTAFSGEEYRQELRAGLEDPLLAGKVRSLAWGSGSGMVREGARSGFVFCARVGDHPEPQFRFVPLDPDVEIVRDTLSCLAASYATVDTPRDLNEEMHRAAYDAWARARYDIYDRWLEATDPANLSPAVPKAMRDAAQLLRDHPPSDVEQGELDRLLDAIEAPYGERILRLIRRSMDPDLKPTEQATAVVETVRELGLEPGEAPQPLPVIEEEDVNLVCWMAIVGTAGTVSA